MRRVLFVDDEPLILQGYECMLHPLADEWEMTFLSDPAEVLPFMERTPVDVVVSDMHMPGMNGAQLLKEVMARYPQTVRLILSGNPGQDLILDCVGTTHQCLSKPCDAETLRRTIERLGRHGNSLQNPMLKKLVCRMDRLPTVPSLYLQMVETIEDPNASVEDVAGVVHRDLAMTAKLLKLANSAYFGLSQPIVSPFEAVSYLGVGTIKSLVLSLQVFSQYESSPLGGLSLEHVWEHSLQTADAATSLALYQDCRPNEVDEAFVSGLLHDVGKLVLALNCPDEYAEAVRQAQAERLPLLETEKRSFSCTHADVGGYLLGLWGLPVSVVEAIALHHTPSLSLDDSFSPLAAVHISNELAHDAAVSAVSAPAGSNLDGAYLRRLGLEGDLDHWRDTIQAHAAAAEVI